MEKFDSSVEAIRYIQKLTDDLNKFNQFGYVYLMVCETSMEYYVCLNAYHLEKEMAKKFDGGDSPESLASMFKVYKYVPEIFKDKFPFTYKGAKKSSVKGMLRIEMNVIPEYSVTFSIQ